MIPSSITATSVIAAAGTTANEFGSTALLVLGIWLGLWGVGFLVRLLRRGVVDRTSWEYSDAPSAVEKSIARHEQKVERRSVAAYRKLKRSGVMRNGVYQGERRNYRSRV